MEEQGARFYVGVTSEEVTEQGMVIVDKDGEKHLIAFDTIVIAAGSTPNDKLYMNLKGEVPEVYCIGDVKQTRYVKDAISEGFMAAYAL